MKAQLGVIHGRFQGLHLGHMEYLLEAKNRCEHLLVGITNYDLDDKKADNVYNKTRANEESNPFTFYDRYIMIKESLLEYGLQLEDFDIIPFPIENPDRIHNFAPMDAVFYLTIYDQWGERKLEILNRQGLQTEVMWVRDNSTRITSGTQVRQLIAENKEWQHLVPKAVYRYITENGLDSKIRQGRQNL